MERVRSNVPFAHDQVSFEGGDGTDTLYIQKVDESGILIHDSTFSGIEEIAFAPVEGGLAQSISLVFSGPSMPFSDPMTVVGDAAAAENMMFDFSEATAGLTMSLADWTFVDWSNWLGVRVTGSSFNDTLTGASVSSDIDGAGGNDILVGRFAGDRIHGGAGDDTVGGGDGNDTLYGDEGHDYLLGDQDNDLLYGGAGRDTLVGGLGDDELFAGNYADNLEGNEGFDTLHAGKGNDTVSGGNGDDLIYASFGNDWILGDDGDDEIRGERGKDTIDGGDGNDTLYGGAGSDVFEFSANHGDDHIGGFKTRGQDKIDLTDIGLSGFGDLTLTADGNNTIVDTGEGTITLWNVAVTDVSAGDFLF